MPKKILQLKLESMAFGGEAVANYEGKKVFVAWGVAGDVVKAEILEEKKDFARARILEIIEKSPERTQASCRYFFKCGGCQWQHIRYESQIAFKQEMLKTALQRIGKIAQPALLDPIASTEPFHYRGKIRLQLSRQGKLGFYRPHSKEVVEIDTCAIAREELNAKIPEALALGRQLLAQDRAKLHEIEIHLDEQGRARLNADQEEGSVFSQANQAQNEVLKNRVLEALELSGSEGVLELFAGEGNFTFPLAGKSSRVLAVESNSQAVLRGEAKAAKLHARNVEWLESTAHRYLARAKSSESFDRILLDPPRMGLMEGAADLAAMKAPILVYVSCDPSTLARDLKELLRLGYRHDFSQLVDMFPQTYHVESITRLRLA